MESAKNNKAIFAYFMVIALDAISYGLIGPILAPLLAHPSIFFTADHSVFFHYALYGVMIALFPLTYMLTAPVLGILSDRFGRKRVLLCASFFISLSFISYALAFLWKNIWVFIFARTIGGLSAGSQGVAQAAVADFAKRREKPIMISIIAIGMTMGLIIGPLVASLWTHTSPALPFCIITLLSLLSLYLLFAFVPENRIASATQSFSLRTLMQTPKVLKLFGTFFLFELGWSLYYQSLPLWLSLHFHLQNHQIGFVSSYIGMMLALFLFLGTRIGLRFTSLTNLILYSFCFGAASLIFVTQNISLFPFLLSALPIVLAVALIYPGLIAKLSELIAPEQQGFLMGLSDALLALAFTITGMLASLLAYFNPGLPFLLAAIFWGIAALGCFKYKIVLEPVHT